MRQAQFPGAGGLNLRGAIDLGSLAAANAAAEQAAARAAAGLPSAVIDVTDATFEVDVLQRSMTNVVVVDLWATWCQPCKTLSPILERVTESLNGAIYLAKVDVDANPAVAQAFRVQSIPAVFAVISGQVMPLFTGAVPETQVKQVFAAVLEQARKLGVACAPFGEEPSTVDAEAEPSEPAGDPRFEAAMNAIDAGDWDAAAAAYESVLASAPADRDAKLGLVLVGLLKRLGDADADALVAAAVTDPADVQKQFDAADALVLNGRYPEAFAVMLALVRSSSGDDRNRARVHLLEMFEIVGDEEPSVLPARQALASALF
ncbi:MAG: hypothetical protein RL745_431 [Actinomycetota bacterium]